MISTPSPIVLILRLETVRQNYNSQFSNSQDKQYRAETTGSPHLTERRWEERRDCCGCELRQNIILRSARLLLLLCLETEQGEYHLSLRKYFSGNCDEKLVYDLAVVLHQNWFDYPAKLVTPVIRFSLVFLSSTFTYKLHWLDYS